MRKLVPALAAGLMMLCMTGAHATEWIHCTSTDNEAELEVLAGAFEFLDVTTANLRAGEQYWTNEPGRHPGRPASIGQLFFGEDQLYIDFEDPETGGWLAQLRVFTSQEGEDYVQGGVLRVAGQGAWIVACEGP